MCRRWFALVVIVGALGANPAVLADAPRRPVDHAKVRLRGPFWGPRLKTHHEVTIPHALDCLERAGHVTNFDKAAGTFDGPLRGHHAFDSDLHKALEGALHSLQHSEDPSLLKRVEGILDRILAAQQEDGFLISYYIVQDSDKRWETLRLEHQLYNAGHFFEAAVEHHRLTGKTRVLDAAKRFADAGAKTFTEIYLTAHGPFGNGTNLFADTGARRQFIYDFRLDEGRVHIERYKSPVAAVHIVLLESQVNLKGASYLQ